MDDTLIVAQAWICRKRLGQQRPGKWVQFPPPPRAKRSDTVYSFQIDQHTDTYETDKLNAMYEWSITPWWQKAIIKVRHFIDTIIGKFKKEEDIPF